MFTNCEQFFHPNYIANLIPSWIPTLKNIKTKLQTKTKMTNINYKLNTSSILLAKAYPNSRITNSNYHNNSIKLTHKHTTNTNITDQVNFKITSTQTFSNQNYNLITTFNYLHNINNPLTTTNHIQQTLTPNDT